MILHLIDIKKLKIKGFNSRLNKSNIKNLGILYKKKFNYIYCSGEEGDRKRGNGHMTYLLYIYCFVLHSPS